MAHVYVETTSKKSSYNQEQLNAVNYIEEFILPVIFLKKIITYILNMK